MQKCVCEREEKEVCVRACVPGEGKRGRGWLFEEVTAAANQLSQWICRRIAA